MDTSALKPFAQEARRQLLDQVGARLEHVLHTDSAELRQKKQTLEELQKQIDQTSKQAVIDRVAYTWFNRFCALRFMDVKHYTLVGIVSPAEGFTQPEILQDAKQGLINESIKVDRVRALALLSGKVTSSNPQQEAYRLLLVGACNAHHEQMPFLFQPIEDYTELLMPDDLLSENSVLQAVRDTLTPEACQDVEVIGWLYQYYISERKDEVFANLKKNKKIQPEDIPAATQLFTPHWIVRYLVENSLGRLWMLNHPKSNLVERMEYYIQPDQEETDFLKIGSPEEIRVCDPACGSGHMLTYAFDLLHAIYEEQGYDPVEIPRRILQTNLYGVEIDQRAGHLGAFALMMKARERDRRFFSRGVEPKICVLENVAFTEEELEAYMDAVGRDLFTQDLQETLTQFEQADNFGSLIQPKVKDVAFIRQRIKDQGVFEDLFLHRTNQRVLKVLSQAEYLSPGYHVVVTNPPYMGKRGMNSRLREFAHRNYPHGKSNTFAMFIERNGKMAVANGSVPIITMQSWMFLSTFRELRERILEEQWIASMAHLGPRAFDSIGGEVVSTTAFVLENNPRPRRKGAFVRLVEGDDEEQKSSILRQTLRKPMVGSRSVLFRASSEDFQEIPGSPVVYWVSDRVREVFSTFQPFRDIGHPKVGMQTSNNDKYLRLWHEISFQDFEDGSKSKPEWIKYLKGGGFRRWYGNLEHILHFNRDPEYILRQDNATVLPLETLDAPKCTWTDLTSSKFSCRIAPLDSFHDISGHCFYPSPDDQLALLAYANSAVFGFLVDLINFSFHYQVGDVARVPVRIDTGVDVSLVTRLIGISEADWNSFETAWAFSTPWFVSSNSRSRQISGSYDAIRAKWLAATLEMKELEESNNSNFIRAFALENDVSPEVPLFELSVVHNPHYRYRNSGGKTYTDAEREAMLLEDTMKELISYAVGCMFGRYSVDNQGLILANQGETAEDYRKQVPDPTFSPDEDNVIPILDESWFEDDIADRFKQFLQVAFGIDSYDENSTFLEDAIGSDIRSYFLKSFYGEHVKMYKQRPIYWMFSSPNGSFNALIYMHRYRPDTISVILNDYLRQYREKLLAHRAGLEQVSIGSSASRSEKTKALRKIERISKILTELKVYEDEILYPLASEQVEIDLDDGVKVNYNKFGKALKYVSGLSE